MLAAGFVPDVVSSDIHAFNHRQLGVDLMSTMTKMLALGVPVGRIIEMATRNPATALRRPELGRLAVGAAGDASVLRIEEAEIDLVDRVNEHMRATRKFVAAGAVRAGRWHRVTADG
jgi:dihydroorotase